MQPQRPQTPELRSDQAIPAGSGTDRARREVRILPVCCQYSLRKSPGREKLPNFTVRGDWLFEQYCQVLLQFKRAGCEQAGFEEVRGISVEVTDSSARFSNQKYTCCDIPDIEAAGPEGIDPAGGEVGEIQCGRAGSLHGLECLQIGRAHV